MGKKILVVDDDMRNVFALTSILEEKGIEVIMGRNGREGLEKLSDHPGYGPGPDGYHDAGDERLRSHAGRSGNIPNTKTCP